MNCKKCGFQLTENDQFCKNCGTPVENTSVQNNNGGFVNQQNFSGPAMNNNAGPAMQQQSWTNGYNTQPSQPAKGNNTKYIIIGIVAVAVIAVGIILATNVFGGNKENNNNNNNNNGGSTVNNNNNNNNNNTSTYTVKFKGFTFKVPTNLIYETRIDSIVVGDEASTWAAYIEVVEGSYSKIVSNKGQLQGAYQKSGYTATPAAEKTIGGMSFITLEISMGGANAVLGFTKANSMNIFGVTAYNSDNEIDYSLLEKVAGILSSAEYSGTANNITGFEKPTMNEISELAK